MADFASALEGVLLHAVAALEAEDAGTTTDALTAYNSAWCALTCAVELHGGPDGSGLQELVRETCRALLDTYRLRFEALGGAGEDGCASVVPGHAHGSDARPRSNGNMDKLAVVGSFAAGGPLGSDTCDVGQMQEGQGTAVECAWDPQQAQISRDGPYCSSMMSGDGDPYHQRLCQRRRLDLAPAHIAAACANTPDSSSWQPPQQCGRKPTTGDGRSNQQDQPGTPVKCRHPCASTLSSAAPTQQPQPQNRQTGKHAPALPAATAATAWRGGGPLQPGPADASVAQPDGDSGDVVDGAMMEVLRQCQRHVAPGGSLDELAGLGDIKRELRMALLLPLRRPHLFTGIRHPPRNFLLHGPPGTGKTMLVERIAAETGAALLVLTPGAILSKWAGESEKQLRAVFTAAACMGRPCIVFMDEVDSLGSARGSGDDPMSRRLLNELLVHMSLLAGQQQHQQGHQRQHALQKPQQLPRLGPCSAPAGQPHGANPADSGNGNAVYVFAATNRIQDCDPALLRRFDRRIAVPLPDTAARLDFLRGVLEQPELAGHVLTPDHVIKLAEMTAGYSGSDLSQLCREAAMRPLRELLERQLSDLTAHRPWPSSGAGGLDMAPSTNAEESHGDVRALAMGDFAQAMLTVRTAAADAGM